MGAVIDELRTTPAVRPSPLETLQDGVILYELVGGELVEKKTSYLASLVASRFFGLLFMHLHRNSVGHAVSEGVFILDRAAGLKRRPDADFVSADRWPLDRPFPDKGDLELAPDLAVEVVSPNDTMSEVLAKVREYFQYGVREVWVIVPEERQVLRYTGVSQVRILTENDLLDGAPVVAGWQLTVRDLFPPAAAVPTPATS
jgi:Uma2 family endonuclease